MIDIRRLKLFVAVAEELHFGRAAARVGMAQPPFSQQIRRLERDLDVELLRRTSRRVSLTPAGEELLRSAHDIIARRDGIVDRVKRTASGNAGTLRIGFGASSAIGILPAIVRQIREQLPNVVLHLDDRDGADVAAAIRTGSLDVAIVRAPFTASNLVIQPIHSESFVAVLPAGHALAGREAVTPRELAISPFLLFPRAASPGLHDTIIGLCITDGFSPVVIQEANAWLTVVRLVESGLGITIAPASASRVCPPAVPCIPIVGTTDGSALASVEVRLRGASGTNATRINVTNATSGKLSKSGEILIANGVIVDEPQLAWDGPDRLLITLCEATTFKVRARLLRDPVNRADGSENSIRIDVTNKRYSEQEKRCR